MTRNSTSFIALSFALIATPAAAQEATTPASSAAEAAPDDHHDHNEDIVVTGTRRKVDDVLGGVSVLDGADLAANLRPSIGETLAKQPGVSATSFGPAASRPILRGLGGETLRPAGRRSGGGDQPERRARPGSDHRRL